MISPKFLKNSARVSSLLNEKKSASMDVNFHRLKGPANRKNCENCASTSDLDNQEIFLEEEKVTVRTKNEKTGEYMVILEG